MFEAKRLLCFSEKSIKEIAWELGFEEASHFSHFFKSAENSNRPPESFRKTWLTETKANGNKIEQISTDFWPVKI